MNARRMTWTAGRVPADYVLGAVRPCCLALSSTTRGGDARAGAMLARESASSRPAWPPRRACPTVAA